MEKQRISAAATEFDPDRIVRTLIECGVDFVLVGGLAARLHGSDRSTGDVDCLPARDIENFDRLAVAMRKLNARLRIAGMTDDESKRLIVTLDAHTLMSFGGSTWTTDAGPLDVLVELRDQSGRALNYDELVERAVIVRIGSAAVRLAALRDIIEAKTFAGRQKDHEALPELHRLLRDYDKEQ
ncbi:MAG: hypothetical protein ACKOA5_11610 [Actinomycetota bacterium]